jgi:hypothetical protein
MSPLQRFLQTRVGTWLFLCIVAPIATIIAERHEHKD